jgi:hypothetical protein
MQQTEGAGVQLEHRQRPHMHAHERASDMKAVAGLKYSPRQLQGAFQNCKEQTANEERSLLEAPKLCALNNPTGQLQQPYNAPPPSHRASWDCTELHYT